MYSTVSAWRRGDSRSVVKGSKEERYVTNDGGAGMSRGGGLSPPLAVLKSCGEYPPGGHMTIHPSLASWHDHARGRLPMWCGRWLEDTGVGEVVWARLSLRSVWDGELESVGQREASGEEK